MYGQLLSGGHLVSSAISLCSCLLRATVELHTGPELVQKGNFRIGETIHFEWGLLISVLFTAHQKEYE
jgi:hypothetical protein